MITEVKTVEKIIKDLKTEQLPLEQKWNVKSLSLDE